MRTWLVREPECIGALGQFRRAAPLGALMVENPRPVATTDKQKDGDVKMKFLQCVANRDAGKIKHCYWPRIL